MELIIDQQGLRPAAVAYDCACGVSDLAKEGKGGPQAGEHVPPLVTGRLHGKLHNQVRRV